MCERSRVQKPGQLFLNRTKSQKMLLQLPLLTKFPLLNRINLQNLNITVFFNQTVILILNEAALPRPLVMQVGKYTLHHA